MTRLVLNDVWREAANRLSSQAAVLVPIAAGFVMLPTLVLYKAYPELGDMAGRMASKAEVGKLWPALLAAALVQVYGQLALIAVATDGGRSTVGGAMSRALSALPRVILAFILMILGLSAAIFLIALVLVVPSTMLGAASTPANMARTGALLTALLFVPMALFLTRLCLFAVIAVAKQAGPADSLKRSWRATKGHFGAIFALMMLTFIGLLAAQALVGLVAGGTARAIDAMVGGHGIPQFLASAISGAVGAVGTIYFAMLLVAIWRRLGASA